MTTRPKDTVDAIRYPDAWAGYVLDRPEPYLETKMNDKHPLDGLLEPGASKYDPIVSIAISLKRIADGLGGTPESGDFLTRLYGVLGDASHDHAHRMRP
jgi:hypothetical protein